MKSAPNDCHVDTLAQSHVILETVHLVLRRSILPATVVEPRQDQCVFRAQVSLLSVLGFATQLSIAAGIIVERGAAQENGKPPSDKLLNASFAMRIYHLEHWKKALKQNIYVLGNAVDP